MIKVWAIEQNPQNSPVAPGQYNFFFTMRTMG